MIRQIGKGIIISALTVCALTSVASAQGNGGIGGRPANPDPENPRTQSIFIYTLDRGESKTDQVLISNNSSERRTIELLAVDGIVTNTGAYSCKQNAEEKTGLGANIQLSKKQVILEPNTNTEVDFTVTMPANADVGEHNACLVFQSPQDKGEMKGNIRLRTRQAIRIVATVPGELKRSIDITNFGVATKDSQETFTLGLKNTGNVSADVNTKIFMRNLLGMSVYEDGGQYPVLAGEKLELTFANTKRPFFGGWYTAGASITYDKRAGVFGVEDSANSIQKTANSETIFIRPTIAGLVTMILAAVLAVAGLVAWLAARKKRRYEEQTWKKYTVKSGDTLVSVAEEHGVDWRKLARRNNLKPPYTLRADDTIKVPSGAVKKSNS